MTCYHANTLPGQRNLRHRPRYVVALATSCAAVLSLAGAAHADAAGSGAASVDRFSFTFTEAIETALPECLDPDLVGTGVGNSVVTGHAVETSSGVFIINFTVVTFFHLDFPNGMYMDGDGEVDHNHFVTNNSVVVSNFVTRDPQTIYNADGTPIVHSVIHAGAHLTYHDLNGDGVPQEDEISASVDRFFFTCH